MDARRFYGQGNTQSTSPSSDESDISCEDSDEYNPSCSSSSELFESDVDNFSLRTSSSDDNDDQPSSSSRNRASGTWFAVDGTHRKQFVFTDDSGIYGFNGLSADTVKPIDVYSMMVTDDIYNLIVEQTNLNAQQVMANRRIRRSSRLKKWKDTDKEEMKKFLAIVLYMGMVKYPTIYSYWSRDPFYMNSFVPKIMSRNRFQLLLRFIHFADNQSRGVDDRLYKVRQLLELLERNFTTCRKPGETVAIDETMVPWRGRLVFRQYNPGKSHKYGVKIYKLCDPKGYTYTSCVYSGKDGHQVRGRPTATTTHSSQIVLDLAERYLKSGRTVTTDNYYTSVALANILLENQTHLVGTLRRNRAGNPRSVTEERLKKGDIVGRENEDGIVVAKWKSRRDVLMLSTKHDIGIVDTGRKNRLNEEVMKPEIICCYNQGKQGIDVSDQMASYFTPLRKTIRWYHKVGFEYLLNTAVINALIIYEEIRDEGHVQVAKFRHDLIYALAAMTPFNPRISIQRRRPAPAPAAAATAASHHLEKYTERNSQNRLKRSRCTQCYYDIQKSEDRATAAKKAKKVSTYCRDCEGHPAFCIGCFAKHA